MKKIFFLLLIFFLLTLTACGVSSPAQPGAAPASQSTSALPAATQLLLGTLKLDGTAQAVTGDQAEELLPLWQTMSVLMESDTAANQEKEALTAQIQETMTAEQRQAITGMNLTREDMLSLMQQQGPALSGGSQNNNSQSRSSSGGASGPRGDRPPEVMFMPGGGGGFSGGGQNLSAEQIATAQAARQGSENFVPPALINAVIDYLKEKAGA